MEHGFGGLNGFARIFLTPNPYPIFIRQNSLKITTFAPAKQINNST